MLHSVLRLYLKVTAVASTSAIPCRVASSHLPRHVPGRFPSLSALETLFFKQIVFQKLPCVGQLGNLKCKSFQWAAQSCVEGSLLKCPAYTEPSL